MLVPQIFLLIVYLENLLQSVEISPGAVALLLDKIVSDKDEDLGGKIRIKFLDKPADILAYVMHC
jgi:hypothetical protein